MLWDKTLAFFFFFLFVHNSELFCFSKLTELSSHHHNAVLEHFQLPIKVPCAHS